MKPLKILGLGALTVLLAMALGGVPSAMAEGTELCSADETPCKSEKAITHVHEATPEGKKAALLSSFGNVECNVLFLGDTAEATEGPAFVDGNFTYTSCLLKGSACEVKEVSKSSSFSILKESHETGSVSLKGELNVKCGAFINCTFIEENLKGTYKGQLLSTLTNGEMSINAAAIGKVTGALCPKEGNKLDITMTPLVKTFLSLGTMYCVRYENSRGRWLLGPNSTTCTGNHGVRGFNYELVWSRNPGLTTGSMLCVRGPDLYYLVRNGTLCEVKDGEPEGTYELGEVA
jgi:hypothetical protein